MAYCTSIVKCVLLSFNFLIMVIGLALITLGVLMKLAVAGLAIFMKICPEHISTYVIVLGSVVTLISIIGCFGGCKEYTLLLTIYAIFMLIFAVSTAILAVVIFEKTTRFMTEVQLYIEQQFTKNIKGFSEIEKRFRCCGLLGAQSYENTGLSLSETCLKNAYSSCIGKISPIVETYCEIAGGISFGLVITQLVLVVLSVYLAVKVSKKDGVRTKPY